MNEHEFALSDVVRAKASAAGATGWLAALPTLVRSLADEWELVIGRTFPDGTEALVVEAEMSDGTSAVLKLLIPRNDYVVTDEITVLRLAQGDGCATLYRHDIARGALLMERLGPSLHEMGLPIAQRHEILCTVAARLWRPAPDSGLISGSRKAAWLRDEITSMWEELDHPCSERAVAHALACAERRGAAHNDERAVLVHGDVHEWNVLTTLDHSGYKLVDPDGLLAEAEYDLGVIMREDPEDFMSGDPRARSRWLAARCGLNEQAIWEWGVIERVSTGLLLTKIGVQPIGALMLAAAEHAARLSTS